MEAIIQSLFTGFPVLILHSSVTLAILIVAVFLYVKITPYDEIALIKDGNTAAAISLAGAIIGFALPLSCALSSSITVYEILLWGPVTLLLQLVAFRITDALLSDLPKRIIVGQIGPSIFLVSIKISVAAINAAAVSG